MRWHILPRFLLFLWMISGHTKNGRKKPHVISCNDLNVCLFVFFTLNKMWLLWRFTLCLLYIIRNTAVDCILKQLVHTDTSFYMNLGFFLMPLSLKAFYCVPYVYIGTACGVMKYCLQYCDNLFKQCGWMYCPLRINLPQCCELKNATVLVC